MRASERTETTRELTHVRALIEAPMNSKSKGGVAAAMLILFSCAAVCAAQEIEEVIKVNVALVTVNVLVTDAKGQPRSGLQAADFRVTEEGKPMRVEFFDHLGAASIVLVIDLS